MLAQIRGERRLEDIADQLEVSISTVQRWEKASMSIPSLRLPDIAKAYGCSIHDIFAEDDGGEPGDAAQVIDIWSRIPADRRDEAKQLLSVIAQKRA